MRVAGQVATNIANQKIEFVKGMLTCPIQTLKEEYLEPLQEAGKLLGKACYLACTDPERLKNGAVNRFNQMVAAAKVTDTLILR